MAKAMLLLTAAAVIYAQQQVHFHAPWVSCFDSTGQFVGPSIVRTDPLESSDGKLRAYAEISAAVDAHSGCGNTVRLFISRNGLPFRLVFTQAPSLTTGTADSLGPVAWSPDGRWLAVEVGYWFYDSDNASQGLLLYDSRTHATSRPDVVKQIERALRRNCSPELRSVIGFDSRNRVVLSVTDSQDEEGRPGGCLEGGAEWLYDPVTRRAIPIVVAR